MTAIHISLPDALAQKARELAEHDGISLEEFVSTAVSGRIASDVLKQRAARGSREKFERALEQVPDLPPDEGDRL